MGGKIITILLLLLSPFIYSQQENISAKINVFSEDIFIGVDLIVENNNFIYNDKLKAFFFTLTEQSKGHYIRDSDMYEFSILPNERKIIATKKIITDPSKEIKLYLFIRANDSTIIAEDVAIINNKVNKINNDIDDGIEIIGLVTDNVKTRFGKDFYDIFYQYYTKTGIKYSFVINIEEKPSFGGRGSLISIKVGDDKIFEFRASPNEELFKKVSLHTLKLLDKFDKERKLITNYY